MSIDKAEIVHWPELNLELVICKERLEDMLCNVMQYSIALTCKQGAHSASAGSCRMGTATAGRAVKLSATVNVY